MDKYRQAIIDLDREEPHDRPKDLELLNEAIEVLEIIKKYSFLQKGYKEGYGSYDQFLCNIHTIGKFTFSTFGFFGMKEDYEKVKKWLENV